MWCGVSWSLCGAWLNGDSRHSGLTANFMSHISSTFALLTLLHLLLVLVGITMGGTSKTHIVITCLILAFVWNNHENYQVVQRSLFVTTAFVPKQIVFNQVNYCSQTTMFGSQFLCSCIDIVLVNSVLISRSYCTMCDSGRLPSLQQDGHRKQHLNIPED